MRKAMLTFALTSAVTVLGGCSTMGPGEQTGVTGAAASTPVGSQFEEGVGNSAGTGMGAATGAVVGGAVDRSADDAQRYNYRQGR